MDSTIKKIAPAKYCEGVMHLLLTQHSYNSSKSIATSSVEFNNEYIMTS